MKTFKRKGWVLALSAAAVLGAGIATPALAVPVDLEMVLAMDVSGSISDSDFVLQRNGYRDAFLSAGVQAAIASKVNGVAVSLVQWSTSPGTTIGWTHLTDAASATSFANLINSMTRSASASTGTTNAVTYSAAQFAGNGFEGGRLVIDVSSDGEDNVAAGCGDFVSTCAPLQAARDNFLASLGSATGAINALWMADPGSYTAAELLAYGTSNLIGGSNSFQLSITDQANFADAIATKIGREFNIPEPSTLPLLGLALVGWAAIKKYRVAPKRG